MLYIERRRRSVSAVMSMRNAPATLAALPRGSADSGGASGSSAAEAGAAAEFASKKYVWIPDKEAGYLPGWVVREEQNGEVVVVALPDGSVSD